MKTTLGVGISVLSALAGRTAVCTLFPLSIDELKDAGFTDIGRDVLMLNGFMPRHYDDGLDPLALYRDYFADVSDWCR